LSIATRTKPQPHKAAADRAETSGPDATLSKAGMILNRLQSSKKNQIPKIKQTPKKKADSKEECRERGRNQTAGETTNTEEEEDNGTKLSTEK